MTTGIDYGRLRRVRDVILADPERFSMEDWVSDGGRCQCIGGIAAIDAGYITLRKSPCPLTLRFYDVTPSAAVIGKHVNDEARFRVALNLTPEEADRLFDVACWPPPFGTEYALANTPTLRAEVAARRIDFFIKTRGLQ